MDSNEPNAVFGFETDRLSVRRLTQADEALFVSLYTDPETMRFVAPALTAERAMKSFRTALRLTGEEPPTHVFLTIVEKAALQPVGVCSVLGIDRMNSRTEVGMMLTARARARGIATEGLTALIRRAFEVLDIGQVWVQISEDHAIVQRLVVRVGLQPICGEPPMGAKAGREIWTATRGPWLEGLTTSDKEK